MKKQIRDKWKKENPIYMKLYKMMYRRCYKFRKGGGENIPMKITEMLGCSIMQLSTYLEDKWVDGMDWDNYGKLWEIDHIVPLCSDKTLEGFIKLNHYTNLQPLLRDENKRKGRKIL